MLLRRRRRRQQQQRVHWPLINVIAYRVRTYIQAKGDIHRKDGLHSCINNV